MRRWRPYRRSGRERGVVQWSPPDGVEQGAEGSRARQNRPLAMVLWTARRSESSLLVVTWLSFPTRERRSTLRPRSDGQASALRGLVYNVRTGERHRPIQRDRSTRHSARASSTTVEIDPNRTRSPLATSTGSFGRRRVPLTTVPFLLSASERTQWSGSL